MNSGNIKVHWLKDKDIFLFFDNKATERHVNFYKKLRNVQFFLQVFKMLWAFVWYNQFIHFCAYLIFIIAPSWPVRKRPCYSTSQKKKINHINKSPFR